MKFYISISMWGVFFISKFVQYYNFLINSKPKYTIEICTPLIQVLSCFLFEGAVRGIKTIIKTLLFLLFGEVLCRRICSVSM